MSVEYKFNFFVVQLTREEYNSSDPNKTFFKVRFYQKPHLVNQQSRALPFKTFKKAEECAKSYERIGFKSKVLKFEAKLTTLTEGKNK